jgi:hypothetical protein
MEIILILIIALVVFDIGTFAWGFDSRDGIESSQWKQRQSWPASY